MVSGLSAIKLEQVYECWVSDKADTFVKLYTRTEVEFWLRGQLLRLDTHDRIHIVLHDPSEYYTDNDMVVM